MSTYLAVNLAAISIPLLFSFHPKFPFYRHWKYFFPACLLTALPFLIWDGYFTHLGIWGFNDLHLLNIGWFEMPLEEYLFFFCIPYACTFTYFGLKILLPRWRWNIQWLYLGLGCLLLALGIWHIDKYYTSWTFLATGCFLTFLGIRKPPFLFLMLLSYLFILPPFYLTNGVLTGSWIPEEVVWYNDLENLGIRIGTIPVEDTIYGMLLVMLNIVLYEFLIRRFQADNF